MGRRPRLHLIQRQSSREGQPGRELRAAALFLPLLTLALREVHQSTPMRDGHGLRAADGIEFRQNPLNMRLRSAFGDIQAPRDILVAATFSQQLQYVQLALRQARLAHADQRLRRNRRRGPLLVDRSNRRQNLLPRSILENVALSALAETAEDVLIAVVGRHDEHPRYGIRLSTVRCRRASIWHLTP
jgi:hypothetical protein